MNRLLNDKSFYVIVVMLFIVGAISSKVVFQEFVEEDNINIHAFPKEFGEWTSREIPIDEQEYDILETRNTFSREYIHANGDRLFLFIVYSQSNRKVFHPPEICYTGGGATIVNNARVRFKLGPRRTLPANQFVIEMEDSQQAMYYFFKVGGSYTANYWYQQILVSLKTFLGQHQGSAMIRMTVPYNSHKPAESTRIVQEFILEILPYIKQYLP